MGEFAETPRSGGGGHAAPLTCLVLSECLAIFVPNKESLGAGRQAGEAACTAGLRAVLWRTARGIPGAEGRGLPPSALQTGQSAPRPRPRRSSRPSPDAENATAEVLTGSVRVTTAPRPHVHTPTRMQRGQAPAPSLHSCRRLCLARPTAVSLN